MDAHDREILACLQEDATLSVAEIGERVSPKRARRGWGTVQAEVKFFNFFISYGFFYFYFF
jgi:hypothetical protein